MVISGVYIIVYKKVIEETVEECKTAKRLYSVILVIGTLNILILFKNNITNVNKLAFFLEKPDLFQCRDKDN